MDPTGKDDLKRVNIDWSQVGPIMATTKCCGTGTCSGWVVRGKKETDRIVVCEASNPLELLQRMGSLRKSVS